MSNATFSETVSSSGKSGMPPLRVRAPPSPSLPAPSRHAGGPAEPRPVTAQPYRAVASTSDNFRDSESQECMNNFQTGSDGPRPQVLSFNNFKLNRGGTAASGRLRPRPSAAEQLDPDASPRPLPPLPCRGASAAAPPARPAGRPVRVARTRPGCGTGSVGHSASSALRPGPQRGPPGRAAARPPARRRASDGQRLKMSWSPHGPQRRSKTMRRMMPRHPRCLSR